MFKLVGRYLSSSSFMCLAMVSVLTLGACGSRSPESTSSADPAVARGRPIAVAARITTVAGIEEGWNVRTRSCAATGEFTTYGCFAVDTSDSIICNGIRYAYVPWFQGYVAAGALAFGACSGG